MALQLKLRIIFFLVFCLPGLAVVGYAAKLAVGSVHLAHEGSLATGTILRYERPRYSGRIKLGRRPCAVIAFGYAGGAHTFADDWCRKSSAAWPVGSAVAVVYDPEAPANARINGFWELYGASLLSALIGLPWLLLGAALVLRVRR